MIMEISSKYFKSACLGLTFVFGFGVMCFAQNAIQLVKPETIVTNERIEGENPPLALKDETVSGKEDLDSDIAKDTSDTSNKVEMPGDMENETIVKFMPKKQRNPMLSPKDREILQAQIEQKKLEREAELERLRKKKLEEERKNSPEYKVQVSGIIGKQAIINGEIANEGDIVNGVKVLIIGSNYVKFKYGNRTFMKEVKF
jgi:hypothetical protein